MAGPFRRSDPGPARDFIREWFGRSGPTEPGQAVRIANRGVLQQQAGLSPNYGEARGHGKTPEHPGRPKTGSVPPPERAARQERLDRAREATRGATQFNTGGRYYAGVRTRAQLEQLLQRTIRAGQPGWGFRLAARFRLAGGDSQWITLGGAGELTVRGALRELNGPPERRSLRQFVLWLQDRVGLRGGASNPTLQKGGVRVFIDPPASVGRAA
jgi:hypothetical protein